MLAETRFLQPPDPTPPATVAVSPLPVELALVRNQLGYPASFSDERITQLVWQAVSYIEAETGLLIRRGEYQYRWGTFPRNGGPLVVPGLRALVAEIDYNDSSGAAVTSELSRGIYAQNGWEGRTLRQSIYPLSGSWPEQPLRFDFRNRVSGSGMAGVDAENMPDGLKIAVLHAIRYQSDESEASRIILRDILRGWTFHE